MTKIGKSGRRVFACIRSYIKRHGIAPTVPDMAKFLGVSSTQTVRYQMDQLKLAGLIDWERGKNRTLRLTKKGASMGTLWIVSGPSGAGRSTLVHRLVGAVPGLSEVAQHTDRDKRANEAQEHPYKFVSPSWFSNKVKMNEFAAVVTEGAHRYGYETYEIDRALERGDAVVIAGGRAAEQLRQHYPDAKVIFLRPADKMEMRRRLVSKGLDEKTLEDRLASIDAECPYEMYADLVVHPQDAEGAFNLARWYIVKERTGELVGLV